MQQELDSTQRKALRGVAMRLKPEIFVGKAGVTPSLINQMKQALDQHELVKVKFSARPKAKKEMLCNTLAVDTESCLCGMVGHSASFFKQNPDPEKRLVQL
jgi:RNA-binding protein